MRLFLLSAFTLVLATLTSSAQSLSVFDMDASQFPVMKAKFYAFDESGEQAEPLESEITVTESGVPRTVLSVTCPSTDAPKALSSVLVMDISGSMVKESAAKLDFAKSVAAAWVRTLPSGKSECALTSFNAPALGR